MGPNRPRRERMQLTLSLLESPAPLAHLWEGLPDEDRNAVLRILARLMARMAGLEEQQDE
jgi:hypothetical protein